MKTLNTIWIITLAFTFYATAEDRFPSFSETSLKVAIPTEMQGYQSIPKDQPTPDYEVVTNVNTIVTNAIFTLTGQIFTNATDGQIQTTSEGFSGITDKSTPWKTLTELLAVYRQGSDQKKLGLFTMLRQNRFLIKFTARLK